MTWIEEEEEILKIENNPKKENMASIKCYYVYVNMKKCIEKIATEEYAPSSTTEPGKIHPNGIEISSNKVLQMIQSKKIHTPHSKYVFKEAFMFVVDIEPENIQEWVNEITPRSNHSKKFWKSINITSNIVIPSSISVFHKINSMYFFFEEKKTSIQTIEPKSILKMVITKKQMEHKTENKNKTHKKVMITT